MGRKQADAFYEFHEQAITPLKNRVTYLENHSATSVTSAIKIAVGDTQPSFSNGIWFDTSPYASIQGATKTFYLKPVNNNDSF